ncbi:uncharacterized protein LOC143212269 [Lasioglossum baleicum]|uniref:uncharacterized protein LOC143212269 n=1 Tax=Lasioglossum baleicum TaxID=434251 RepID=UPI003FCD230D
MPGRRVVCRAEPCRVVSCRRTVPFARPEKERKKQRKKEGKKDTVSRESGSDFVTDAIVVCVAGVQGIVRRGLSSRVASCRERKKELYRCNVLRDYRKLSDSISVPCARGRSRVRKAFFGRQTPQPSSRAVFGGRDPRASN